MTRRTADHHHHHHKSLIVFSWLVVFACCCMPGGVVDAKAIQLTVETFEEKVTGRTIFLKFFAPWCSHCRAMSEDWDQLAKDMEDHPVALIAKIDCTAEQGQPICEDFDVQGFPTLVYGDPMAAETYDGPRDYESLKEFALTHITKPICSLYQLQNCDTQQQAMIASLELKTTEELEAIVQQVEAKVQEKEVVFDEKVADIQKQYDVLVEEFNQALDDIKRDFSYKYVEQLLTVRQEGSAEGAGSDEL